MKYILYKHKPDKSGCYVFSATTAWKGYKDQIKKPLTTKHTSHREDDVFFSETTAGKSLKLNEIKESHTIQAQVLHKMMMLFQCNY